MDDYTSKTVAQLREISKSKGVFTVKAWRKNKLINALTNFNKTDIVNRRNTYLHKTVEQLRENAKSKGIHTAKKWTKDKIINVLLAFNKTVKKSNTTLKIDSPVNTSLAEIVIIKNMAEVNKLLPEIIDEEELDNLEDKAEIISPNVCSNKDTYSKEILIEQYNLHKHYIEKRIESAKKLKITIRLPSIPEDISENTVKFIIHKLGDKSSSWNCKGDLLSKTEGVQECKCFTSDGPLSFSPSTNWNVIYFLDARNWLKNKFILYKINLTKSSDEWKNIKVSKKQTFEDQVKQGRRPRISWKLLSLQLPTDKVIKVFEGTFEDIFRPLDISK